jgi:hypothetical protein
VPAKLTTGFIFTGGSAAPLLKWPRSFEQNFRVVKWIVSRG